MKFFVSFTFFLFSLFPSLLQANSLPPWSAEITSLVQKGGVYAESSDGKVLFDYQGSQPFVPASTMKIPTAYAAMELLGKDYKFKTEFYMDGAQNLYVKGYGDPYLVSEELDAISGVLKSKGVKKVNQIILDDSYFGDIKIPGVSASLNPYDALNSALSANFNTINIVKTSSGVESAEAQTPMTELTKILAAKAPMGKSRINLAAYPQESLLYVGYLLKAFLEVQGAVVNGSIVKGIVKSDAKLVYQHQSSKSLDQVVQAMLKFSTNFIANQLFLVIGAEKMGAPANLQKSQKVFAEFFSSKIGLKNFHIEEGSGISRENQMSPQQQVKLLKYFEKYKNLLPEKLDNILAKTGTLNGVSCLTGYFNSSQHGEVRFSILLNQSGGYREKIAKILYHQLY